MKKNFLLTLAVLFLTILIASCNMYRGAGKDIEKAGQSMQKDK